MKSINTKYTTSEIGFIVLLLSIMCPSLFTVLSGIFNRLPALNLLSEYIYIIAVIVAIVCSVPYIKKYLKIGDYLFYFLFLIFYLLQYLIYPQNSTYLDDNFVKSMLLAVPLYFIGVLWDIKRFEKPVFILSIVSISWLLFYHLYLYSDVRNIELANEQLGISYQLLFLAEYVTWYTIRHHSIIGVIFIILSVFGLFSFGARGPFVCFVIFVFLYPIFNYYEDKKYRRILFLTIILLLILRNYELIVDSIESFLDDMGMSTRIIDSLLISDLSDESVLERNYYIDRVRNYINESPLSTHGFYGSYDIIGNYTHRIYWDFWVTFGYAFGSILLLILVGIYYKGYRYAANNKEKEFWLILLCCGLIPLFFSDYFLFWGWFYILLGYCVRLIRNKSSIYSCDD